MVREESTRHSSTRLLKLGVNKKLVDELNAVERENLLKRLYSLKKRYNEISRN
jgi:hypothetical protein